MCRKVIQSNGVVDIWGDGKQTRSFLYIDDCIHAVRLLMKSDFMGPVNIGSEEMVTIDRLADIAAEIGEKVVVKNHISGPTGVRGRNSDNRLIEEKLGWKPSWDLKNGMRMTYHWIEGEVIKKEAMV
jgi:nucleoside-diphosphate-sugar epimerase